MGFRRNVIYIPGNNPSMMSKIPAMHPDSFVFDFEDAVAPHDKMPARVLVRECIRNMGLHGNVSYGVRINGLTTEYWEKDLEILMPAQPEFLVLPKTESARDVEVLSAAVATYERALGFEEGSTRILPIIETTLGLERVYEICACKGRVTDIFFGAVDYVLSVQGKYTKTDVEVMYAKSRVVAAARAYGLNPIDSVYTDADDPEGCLRYATVGRQLGYGGMCAIAPRQIELINQAYSPSQEEIQYSRQIIEALEEGHRQGRGSVAFNGKMIDWPVAELAKRVIEMADYLEGRDA